uniref:Uncharacterized protein n=1 Tax=Oryza barthii TaxID=65489 RepID=A0A0D3ESQ1_9ORYZ
MRVAAARVYRVRKAPPISACNIARREVAGKWPPSSDDSSDRLFQQAFSTFQQTPSSSLWQASSDGEEKGQASVLPLATKTANTSL